MPKKRLRPGGVDGVVLVEIFPGFNWHIVPGPKKYWNSSLLLLSHPTVGLGRVGRVKKMRRSVDSP